MKKFIVKFGYFLNEEELEISDEEEPETEAENILEPHREIERKIRQQKEEILSLLKKDSSVTKIYPLENNIEITKLFSVSYFGEPIKFKIKLPFKNQEISQMFYPDTSLYETFEEFNILFDGNFFAIYQKVDPTKRDFLGGPDVRDKIYKLFKEIFPKLRIVGPTPFRENFIFLVSYPDNKIADEIQRHDGDFVIPLGKVDFEEKIYTIFDFFELYLSSIYQTYYSSDKINDIAFKIIIAQKKLNPLFADIVDFKVSNILKYNKIKNIKKLTQDLCELLLDYVLAENEFEGTLSKTAFSINNSNIPLKNYIETLKNETSDYIKIDVDAMFKYIENVRNELNTRSINFSTMISGIIGGVIGALSTIIITLIK